MGNRQSVGTLWLPIRCDCTHPTIDEPLSFNLKILKYLFDRQVYIKIYRHLRGLTKHSSFAKDTVSTIMAPASQSDHDIQF